MNHFNKIQELRQIQIRESELRGELRAPIKQQIERVRKYKDGEKVEVFDENGKSLGIGAIRFAFLAADLESFTINKYVNKPELWDKQINEVIYRVHKLRKDGTISTHRLATCAENRTLMNNYLLPIKVTSEY